MALSGWLLGMEQTTRWCRGNYFITKCVSSSQCKLPVKRPRALHVYPPYGGVLAAQPRAPVSEPWDLDVGPYNPLFSSGSAPHPPGSCSKAAPVGTWWCVSPALPVGSEWWIWVQSTQNCQTPLLHPLRQISPTKTTATLCAAGGETNSTRSTWGTPRRTWGEGAQEE